MNLKTIICVFLLSGCLLSFSQNCLRITTNRFGFTKSYEVHINEEFRYKLRGECSYKKNKIVALGDSSIVFENGTEIKLSQVKAIRLDLKNHLVGSFQFIFIAGGIGFLPLNSINNLLTNTSPVLSEKAGYISASLIAAGLLIRELSIKRIHMTKNKNLKVISINYLHLNEKDKSR